MYALRIVFVEADSLSLPYDQADNEGDVIYLCICFKVFDK